MLKRIPRPSPALVISLIALFAALGGTVYAASKISGSSIKKNSIPGNRLKAGSISGDRLKPDTVTGTQVNEATLAQVPSAKNADHATNADSATNAGAVNGHTAACAAGTQFFGGACWETAARAGSTAPAAAQTCTGAGGQLSDALSLRAFALTSGVTLDAGDEWSSSMNTVTALNVYTVDTVAPNGDINLDNPADTKKFRCVLPLVR